LRFRYTIFISLNCTCN